MRLMPMVGALSCISRKTMAFFALSLIRDTQSVSVVRRGYRASLHSPAHTVYTLLHTFKYRDNAQAVYIEFSASAFTDVLTFTNQQLRLYLSHKEIID